MERFAVPVNEFCRCVGVGRTKAYELINSEKVKSVQIGRRRLILVSSIRRLLGEEAKDEH
jgi:excisionase family DNA binding protein